MENPHTEKASAGPLSETELVALLAGLRKEATPEANFEERFLYDFHERIAREAVCRPARKLLWEHIRQFIANFGGRKLAYGASTLGAGALALGLYSIPSDGEPSKISARKAAIVGHVENALSALKPGAAKEFISIAVGTDEKKSFTRDRMAVEPQVPSFAYLVETEPDFLSVSSSQPVNMGLSSGLETSFPSLTTNLAF
ncbi:MAG: hypothetical protein IKV82_06510 [Akkermansia sp.]|nr:hypothetical protein [Akkermansia sp.]